MSEETLCVYCERAYGHATMCPYNKEFRVPDVTCTCNMTRFKDAWEHHSSCALVQWQPGHLNTQTAVNVRERVKDAYAEGIQMGMELADGIADGTRSVGLPGAPTGAVVGVMHLPSPAERFGEHVMQGVSDKDPWPNEDPTQDPEHRFLKPLKTREQLETEAEIQRKKLNHFLREQTNALIQLPAKEADAKPDGHAAKVLRKFNSGATRDSDEGKNDYEGFLSPLVLEAYGDYMTEHRVQSDGSVRDSDNWQKGMPRTQYMKSLLRHTLDLWKLHRGWPVKPEKRGGVWKLPTKRSLLCSIMFNVMGYLHELLKEELAKQEPAA